MGRYRIESFQNSDGFLVEITDVNSGLSATGHGSTENEARLDAETELRRVSRRKKIRLAGAAVTLGLIGKRLYDDYKRRK